MKKLLSTLIVMFVVLFSSVSIFASEIPEVSDVTSVLQYGESSAGNVTESTLEITPQLRQEILNDMASKGMFYPSILPRAACNHTFGAWVPLKTYKDSTYVSISTCVVYVEDFYRVCSKNCGKLEAKTTRKQLQHSFPSSYGTVYCRNGCGRSIGNF